MQQAMATSAGLWIEKIGAAVGHVTFASDRWSPYEGPQPAALPLRTRQFCILQAHAGQTGILRSTLPV